MDATITTIQRMSVHDGPGIRSTLFLKGCNLRCKWCHNPETWSRQVQLQQTAGRCIGCASCLSVCHAGALSVGDGRIRIDREHCDACGSCVENCPSGALTLVGERISPQEAFRRVARDIPFYAQTGGGVTVSGGEPLLQPLFLEEFLHLCRESDIHTAIETNLAADREVIRKILPDTDLWMCDCKLVDKQAHREATGFDNDIILDNLLFLIESRARIIVRTPVVPSVNDSEEQIGAICTMLRPYMNQLVGYELLRFHTLGFDKFTAYGIGNPMAGSAELSVERFEQLRAHAKSILAITQ